MADLLAPEQMKIKQFVREALADGGAAFWATPGNLEVCIYYPFFLFSLLCLHKTQ